MLWRSASGGQCSTGNTENFATPVWLKLVASASTFSGYYSTDGIGWTLLGNTSVTMSSLLGGLAVTAHNNSYSATATFDHVCTNVAAATADLRAAAGNQQVVLTWATDPAAIGYNVKSSIVSGGSFTTIATNDPTASFTVTGLTNGTPYYFVVSTVNPLGEGVNSARVAATPNAAAAPRVNESHTSTNMVLSWQPAGGRLQIIPALGGTNFWSNVSNGQPVSVPVIRNSNAFFRVVVP
jgi:cellulose 1,4-beta-cellobiosidase